MWVLWEANDFWITKGPSKRKGLVSLQKGTLWLFNLTVIDTCYDESLPTY
jgi:hypothetical protein